MFKNKVNEPALSVLLVATLQKGLFLKAVLLGDGPFAKLPEY
jgi:hypothetical protein